MGEFWQKAVTQWIPILLAMIPGVYAIVRQARKDKADNELARGNQQADIAGSLTNTAMTLVERLTQRVTRIEEELERTKELLQLQTTRVMTLTFGVHRLTEQIKGMGHEPVWIDIEQMRGTHE